MLIADDFLKGSRRSGHRGALAVFIVLCAVCGAWMSFGQQHVETRLPWSCVQLPHRSYRLDIAHMGGGRLRHMSLKNTNAKAKKQTDRRVLQLWKEFRNEKRVPFRPPCLVTPTTTVRSPNPGHEGSGACLLDFTSDSFTSYRSTPPPRCHEDGPKRILHHKLLFILGVS